MKRTNLALLLTLSLLLAACSPVEPLPERPTQTPVATFTQATATSAPTNAVQPSPTVAETAAPTPTNGPPAASPTATVQPTATIPPTPAATPWGESHTSEAGRFRFQAASAFRVSLSGSSATLTHSGERLTIVAVAEDLSSVTTIESALARVVNQLGPTLDAIEAGPSYLVTIDGKDGLAADVVGVRNGEPFAGQVFAVEASSGRWFTGSALQTTSREGARMSVPARDLVAAFLRSVQFL